MNLILALYIECVASCKIYFAGDTNSVRSYGSSSVSSTVQSSVSSAQTAIHNHAFNNRQTMQTMPPQQQQQQQQQQKNVHFSDLQTHQQNGAPLQRQNSGYNQGYDPSDCDLENEFSQRNVPSKIDHDLTNIWGPCESYVLGRS